MKKLTRGFLLFGLLFFSSNSAFALQLLKEVSVDGGVTFFDANSSASAPVTTINSGVLYRLTTSNTLQIDFENVVINDTALGIVDYAVGNLASLQTIVLTASEIPELSLPGGFDTPGTHTNIATVDGTSVVVGGTGQPYSFDDPANVIIVGSVPAPATLALVILGVAGIVGCKRRKKIETT